MIINNKVNGNDLRIITLVTKWMGSTAEDWKRHFELAKLSGYTAVHLTPFQERGMSNSPYSLRNHHQIDTTFFTNVSNKAEKLNELKKVLSYAREKLGLKVFIDVVWNHVSCDTGWLGEQPDAGYNLINSPHLNMAYELDEAIMKFSKRMNGFDIKSEKDIDFLLDKFKTEEYQKLCLWEYFVINNIDEKLGEGDLYNEYKIEHDKKWTRNSMQVIYIKNNNQKKLTREEMKRLLEDENLKLYQIYDNLTLQIFLNLKERHVYERIAEHGPKLGPITDFNPIQPTYFTRTPNGHALVNNGWIWNANPLINFAKDTINHPYLTRQVIIWGDCVKVRYKSKFALSYMLKYTEHMAELFDGFRIDNCHSTPLKTAKKLVTKARLMNPNLILVAELFTGSKDADDIFKMELGIDYLIREAMVEPCPHSLSIKTSDYSNSPFGQLFPHQKKNDNLFCDCTHDNPTLEEKRTAIDVLSNSAIVAFSTCGAIGSVRSYDDLCPNHLNIVTENRNYSTDLTNFMKLKRELFEFRNLMIREGCSEIKATSRDNLIIMKRIDPKIYSGYCLIAHTAFSKIKKPSIVFNIKDFDEFDSELIKILVPKIEDYNESKEYIKGYSFSYEEITKLDNFNLPIGSIMILKIELKEKLRAITKELENMNFYNLFYKLMESFELIEYNEVFFKCPQEEADTYQRGVYSIPGYGDLNFAGFSSLEKLIDIIEREEIEHHPLISNMRGGFWLIDYCVDRLNSIYKNRDSEFREQFSSIVQKIKLLPVEYSVRHIIRLFKEMLSAMKSSFYDNFCIRNEDPLFKELALNLVKLYGKVPSTGLFKDKASNGSLSAGIPYFSTHHMRCWGRDTFISFKGLILSVLKDPLPLARDHLIAFAECYYKGLIPNLLDSQRYPRYNARDATWFFLNALLEFLKQFPNNAAILQTSITNIHTKDSKYLKEIVQDIITAHWNGIEFREDRAGKELDSEMRNEGFNITIWTDKKSGLLYGGNEWNCGTWMDKMGSAPSNKGIPSSARYGANIEINSMLFKVLKYIDLFQIKDAKFIEFCKTWTGKIEISFEEQFWNGHYYKDTLDSDTSLRPNQLIAMAETPELFSSSFANKALNLILEKLLDIGVRTINPDDPKYRPIYDNALFVDDPSVDFGANYHNGPQWLWLLGPLLRSLQNFHHPRYSEVKDHVRQVARIFIDDSGGVPELLNGDGGENRFSCRIQAWSIAQLIEALFN